MSNLLDTEFELRLRNWCLWCRMREGEHYGHAGSIEGRYRSPQHWDPVNPKPEWLLTLNENDAVLVNRAYIYLPEKQRLVIVGMLIERVRQPELARKVGCHHTELGDRLYIAKRMLKNRLAQVDSRELKKRLTV